MGWKWVFYVNAVPLYGITMYTLWHHAPKPDPTALDWLLGSLPFSLQYLMYIPGLILVSILLQLILNQRKLKATTYVYVEPDELEIDEQEWEEDESNERG
jgi:hypothetical protein